MRRGFITLVLLLGGAAAQGGEGIVAVLERSQAARLERMVAVDPASAKAETVRAAVKTLVRALGFVQPFELRVIKGETVAETLQGRIVVANESLADLSAGERMFILAHELGHIELRHWEQTGHLYQKWVPGAVTPDQTEPVAALLGRNASELSHLQELQADAYALRALHVLGLPPHAAVTAFMRFGATHDTATHPGTRKRLAALRAAEAEASDAAQPTTWNDPIVSVRRPD